MVELAAQMPQLRYVPLIVDALPWTSGQAAPVLCNPGRAGRLCRPLGPTRVYACGALHRGGVGTHGPTRRSGVFRRRVLRGIPSPTSGNRQTRPGGAGGLAGTTMRCRWMGRLLWLPVLHQRSLHAADACRLASEGLPTHRSRAGLLQGLFTFCNNVAMDREKPPQPAHAVPAALSFTMVLAQTPGNPSESSIPVCPGGVQLIERLTRPGRAMMHDSLATRSSSTTKGGAGGNIRLMHDC